MNNIFLETTVPPAVLPVTLADLKNYLKVDLNDATENNLITMILSSSLSLLEDYTSLRLINQTVDVWLNQWPFSSSRENKSVWRSGVFEESIAHSLGERSINLPIGPTQSFSQFSTYSDTSEVIHDVNDYFMASLGNKTALTLKSTNQWPTTLLRGLKSIRFRVTVGFGATDSSIPNDIRMALLSLCAFLYENRGDELKEVPHNIKLMLKKYQGARLG